MLTIVTAFAILLCACCKDADKRELVQKELEITREIKGTLTGASTLKYKKAVSISGVSTSGASKIIRVE